MVAEKKNGIVYLVGAGPGDPGLITVRGVECLQRADVVVYDNLANPALLSHAPTGAEMIYAGKRSREHTKTQGEINELLAERAAAGLVVVRLKGGDPFLFGRGGEEAGLLTERGIAWEVVPGVTSALAVPAYAGIPVTHRMVNGSLHIVTGHEGESADGVEVDWGVLARSRGTIVILMGVKNLEEISRRLMAEGLGGNTPLAMIQRGTLPEQRSVVTRLDRAAADVAAAGIKPPALCVIGEVVRLRDSLAWVEKRALFGLQVGVTRPLDENAALAGALTGLGAAVVDVPTMRVKSLKVDAARLRPIAAGDFEWLCFTSANGVREFMRLLFDAQMDARSLAGCRLAVIGARTAEALKRFGLSADLIAQDTTQEGLAEALISEGARSVLVARAQIARKEMEERLRVRGCAVDVLPVYETVPDDNGVERLRHLLEKGNLQVVTFTSARTFEALADSVGAGVRDLLDGTAVAVLGPITRAAVEKSGVQVDIMASQADMTSLADEIVTWWSSRREQ